MAKLKIDYKRIHDGLNSITISVPEELLEFLTTDAVEKLAKANIHYDFGTIVAWKILDEKENK